MLKKIFKFGPKKEDKIEIWSRVKGLPDVIPVQESRHFLPDWWTKTPMWQDNEVKSENIRNNINNKGTIRRCPAVPEFMNMGFVVPLWCDLSIRIFENGSWEWNSPAKEFSFSQHGDSQLKSWLPKHAQPSIILKPDCPWRIKTPPGISMLQLPLFWHFNPHFTVTPGVIWSDIHHEINQQMMFANKTGEFILQRGTPLAQYIPIRREHFDYNVGNETEELANDAFASFYHVRTKFGGGYPQHRKEATKKGECPYHATKK